MEDLSESEKQTLVNALRVAREVFVKDSSTFHEQRNLRLSEQFDRQVKEVDNLIEKIIS